MFDTLMPVLHLALFGAAIGLAAAIGYGRLTGRSR